MHALAKIGLISVAWFSGSACASEVREEPGAAPRPAPSGDHPNPTNRGGAPGLAGKGGASFGGNAGRTMGSGGSSGSPAQTDATAAGAGASGASGASGANTAGSGGTPTAGSEVTAGGAGKASDDHGACPSLTRVRTNGACVNRVSEFAIAKKPTNIVTGADGRIWFDDETSNRIVQIDNDGRPMEQVQVDAKSFPRALVGGRDDAILWYTDSHAETLTKLTTNKQKEVYQLGFSAAGLALGESGDVFLTEFGKSVNRLRPGLASITRYPCGPSDLLLFGPDKKLWFQESTLIARLDPDGDKQTFPMTDSFAASLCVGPDSGIWFTDGSLHQIGRMGLDGVLTRTYDLPAGATPFRIITGPDGALWFTEQGTNQIGRISVKGELTHYPLPTDNALPYALTVGSDHNIWFTEAFSGKVGRLIPDPI